MRFSAHLASVGSAEGGKAPCAEATEVPWVVNPFSVESATGAREAPQTCLLL